MTDEYVDQDWGRSGCASTKPALIEDRVYRRCQLGSSSVMPDPGGDPRTAGFRPVIRHVELERCAVDVLSLTGCLIEDVTITRLKGALWAKHCLFTRVSIRGLLSGARIKSDLPGPQWLEPWVWEEMAEQDAVNSDLVDWSLDVSEAQFRNCILRGVSPNKILIDPDRQAVVTLESLSGAREAFGEDALVGTVGSVIRGASNGKLSGPLVWVEAGSKKADQELDLIRAIHAGGFALPARTS